MKQKKEKKYECWACKTPIAPDKLTPVCGPKHYKLFMKSFSGESVEELLVRKPQYKTFL